MSLLRVLRPEHKAQKNRLWLVHLDRLYILFQVFHSQHRISFEVPLWSMPPRTEPQTGISFTPWAFTFWPKLMTATT